MRLSGLPSTQTAVSLRRLFSSLESGQGRERQQRASRLRWPPQGADRRALETIIREYVLAFLVRQGGGRRHTFFLHPHQRVTCHLWEEPARSCFRLTLSERSLQLVYALQHLAHASSQGEWEEASRRLQRVEPETNGDLLFFYALVRQARPLAGVSQGAPVPIAHCLRSPLSQFAEFETLPVDPGCAQNSLVVLGDPILLPVLGVSLVESWLEVEVAKDGFLPLEQVQAVNERQLAAWSLLWQLLTRVGRTEGLALFAHHFARLWRWRGGFQLLLEQIRQRSRQWARRSEREAFERSWGELFRFGLLLEEWAAYLRGQPWAEMTEAERFLLGEYGRCYEGIAEEVRLLQRELCREI